jgi:sugar fermentation stimulation protein A
MEGLVRAGLPVWLLPAPLGVRRKLAYTWELVEVGGRLVGANTLRANTLARSILERGLLRGLGAGEGLRAEPSLPDGGRADFWWSHRGRGHFLEVKNCHLVYPDRRGYFPDSVSERATRHLGHLVQRVRAGERATVLHLVQRADARAVRPSDVHDPTFAAAARVAREAGVRFRGARVRPELGGYYFDGSLPVDLAPYSTASAQRWRAESAADSGWMRGGRAVGR